MTHIDFLVIGHIARDITPQGDALGGSATYGSITARNLGFHAGILTRARPDFQHRELLNGIATHLLPSEKTTTFENIYHHEQRAQIIHACADPITPRDVPAHWRNTGIVLLGPIAQELDISISRAFSNSLVGAILQGWMREWDSAGRVTNHPELITRLPLSTLQVVFLSEEDIAGNHGLLEWLLAQGPTVALTAGKNGSTIYHAGEVHHVAPRPAKEVDPTGAGDVFAAAYLLHLAETNDVVQAARFANVVASLSVEAPGPAGIPDRQITLRQVVHDDSHRASWNGDSHAR